MQTTLATASANIFTGALNAICGVLVVLIPVGIAATFVIVSSKQRKKEIAQYQQWANHYRLRYDPADDNLAGLSTHSPFNIGRNRQGRNVFRGFHRNRHLIFGEYRYTTGSGKDSHTHRLQVVAVSTPAHRPFLDITRETAGSKFLAWFGVRDLQLESEEFNRRFRIDTDNERFAYDVLNARNMEWLLADIRANMYHFRFEGQWLMTLRDGPLRVEETRFYIDFLNDLIDIVDDFVWKN